MLTSSCIFPHPSTKSKFTDIDVLSSSLWTLNHGLYFPVTLPARDITLADFQFSLPTILCCMLSFSDFFSIWVFLSQTFTNNRTAGGKGGHFFNSSLPFRS